MSLHNTLFSEALELLQKLISIPSFSKEENLTADAIQEFLNKKNIPTNRTMNNVWAMNKHFNPDLPTILLNSHHDTVKPNSGYTRNPFLPEIIDGKLYGLGSNDAGGCLVSLLATFCYFYEKENLKYNFIIAATAEEEISGLNGIELIYPQLGTIDFAIVGEPTLMNLAVAEKGLMVLDCVAVGKSGHAAREEGINALYNAMKDIEWFRTYQFDRVSEHLGKVKMTVTMIQAGTQHNVVPDKCNYVVDVRITDKYTHEEVLEIIKKNVQSMVTPRSMRARSSSIPIEHPIVQAGLKLGRATYGSPTSSDQALIPVTSVKIGPGDSARSHTADEFIYVDEIKEGIELYCAMLEQIV
ncbi:MAG: M20 family metallo-hydrolase [Ignavibacteriae bacterium]|nr:M20 family metallo-hydrolase [Ignavibacteriota bacterium]